LLGIPHPFHTLSIKEKNNPYLPLSASSKLDSGFTLTL
jgi:hypothetical protein